MSFVKIEKLFKDIAQSVDFCSIRYEEEQSEGLLVRQDTTYPPMLGERSGYMVTVHHNGGTGYAASSDLSVTGMKNVFEKAKKWAELSAGKSIINFSHLKMPQNQSEYISPKKIPWQSIPTQEKLARLMATSKQSKISNEIVDWHARLRFVQRKVLYLTNHGARHYSDFSLLSPSVSTRAYKDGESTQRSSDGDMSRQAGYELLDECQFDQLGANLAREALNLLAAPNCPHGKMDLLLAPDQMMLQIHESIGHPLELDRILGDERNYAGTSFVTQDMFGHYRYGSDLLNVTYDPTIEGELASFRVDDEGLAARKVYLIEKGILKKPLGGYISQQRFAINDGVANSRSTGWDRPAMDRMANLNVEPGHSTLEEMIRSVEKGVYMKTNSSWSIDDSRNKFQFGCEYGQMIENGKLTHLVKNPNYRGISESFWRSLKMVGNQDTFKVHGTMNCGKGEPNQVITVGHASPACLFAQVDVFGGV